MAPGRGERALQRWFRPPGHRLGHKQRGGGERDRQASGRHLQHIPEPRRQLAGHHLQGQEAQGVRAQIWHRGVGTRLSASLRASLL